MKNLRGFTLARPVRNFGNLPPCSLYSVLFRGILLLFNLEQSLFIHSYQNSGQPENCKDRYEGTEVTLVRHAP